MSQPKLKIETKYVGDTPFFRVDPAPHPISVSRAFLTTEYGGYNAQLIQRMNKPPFSDIPAIFPKREYNPYLPRSVGAPGLMFTPAEIWWVPLGDSSYKIRGSV